MVIEVDGSIHAAPDQAKYDADRQMFLDQLGLQVLRFSNTQVLTETDAVLQVIADLHWRNFP